MVLIALLDVGEEHLRPALAHQANHEHCDLLACRRLLAKQVAMHLGLRFEEVVGGMA